MNCTPRKIKMLKVEEISPNPYQTRRNFNAKALKELAFSIKEVGLLNPLIVRTTSCGYELICGERRLRAAKMAGFSHVPSIILRSGDKECATISLIENMHREKLGFFEEGEAFFNLMSYHKVKKEVLSKNLSLESTEINEKVRLLGILPEIRYKIEVKGIAENLARELLKLRNVEEQEKALEKIEEGELGERATKNLIRLTLREMAQRKVEERRKRKRGTDISLYINTVKQTLELLIKNGANIDFDQNEDENSVNFTLKINK